MCCVRGNSGGERVFPRNRRHCNDETSPIGGGRDLPLESLWAAGLDGGMGLRDHYRMRGQQQQQQQQHVCPHVQPTPGGSRSTLVPPPSLRIFPPARISASTSAPQLMDSNQSQEAISESSSLMDCTPPSPPPAPAHYISSLRAQSRSGGRTGIGPGGLSPEREPQARLVRYLRSLYRELAACDEGANLPAWAPTLPPGTLCPAHFQPALEVFTGRDPDARETIVLDQLLAAIKTKDGTLLEAPRRVLIEGTPGSGKTATSLRLLHSWATNSNWIGPGIAVALFVPLRELRGGTMATYICKELLPRATEATPWAGDNGYGDFMHVWKSLSQLEDRLLFVLDGYDEAVGMPGPDAGKNTRRDVLGDAIDLLEGRLFPDCRILLTSSSTCATELSRLVHRRVKLLGRDWPQVERLVNVYFNTSTKAKILLDIIDSNSCALKSLARAPLGWLALCLLFQETGISFPESELEVYESLFKCLIRKSLMSKDLYSDEEIPGHYKKLLAQFGKLSLQCLKQNRYTYTDSEIRYQCRGGGADATDLGFLTRGLVFGRTLMRKRSEYFYTPLHPTFAEYLSANYISSIVHYSNILQRELEALPGISNDNRDWDASTALILRFAMSILGRKGHMLFNQLSPLDVPPRTAFLLLKAAGQHPANVSAVCRLVGVSGISWTKSVLHSSASGKTVFTQVHTTPLELEGWSRVLLSESCTLNAIEIIFQLDRTENYVFLLDIFFDALSRNRSLKAIKISSLLGHEFEEDEIVRLTQYIAISLSIGKLKSFELIITCLEERNQERFQGLLDELCHCLKHKTGDSFYKLSLDLNLSSSQVIQLCKMLEGVPKISVLSLPHLCCDRDSLNSIARLIKSRPLASLNLAGSWGVRDDPPSSSGVSMGSGSGSSGGTSSGASLFTHMIKQNSVTSNPSPKTSSSTYFSSLPRGMMGPYNSLGRPATLPRQPIEQFLDAYVTSAESKRNSDSILWQRHFHPSPVCDPSAHTGVSFHKIFEAIRNPMCKLRNLNVSKCLSSLEDAMCLGETVRRSTCLDSLRMEGSTRLSEVLPVLLGLSENNSLLLLDLASPRIILEDNQTQLVCQSLMKNFTLSLLSLDGWTFRIEESGTLNVFISFLHATNIRDLVLSNCRLHLAVHDGKLSGLGRHEDCASEMLACMPEYSSPSVCFLRLGGVQVTVNDRMALRGPTLLPFLRGFSNLCDLDLSVDKNGSSHMTNPLIIDDKNLTTFFQILSVSFKNLKNLRISYWQIVLDEYEKTIRTIARYLKLCNISFLNLDGFVIRDGVRKTPLEHIFIQYVIQNLGKLVWLGLSYIELSSYQATFIGKVIRDKFLGNSLEITTEGQRAESIKTFINTLQEGAKVAVTYTNGTDEIVYIERLVKSNKGCTGFS